MNPKDKGKDYSSVPIDRRQTKKVSQPKTQVGEVLQGRFRIESVLGRGMFGEVLEVFDQKTKAHYALKREIADAENKTSHIELACQLTHPHIAATRFHEMDETLQLTYILMDLVRGQDMHTWLEGERKRRGNVHNPLPMDLVLGIAHQIAEALDYAHAIPIISRSGKRSQHVGVIHRDLKPANIMVVSGEEKAPGVPFIKIVDFGMAKQIQASICGLSIAGLQNEIAGSLAYMAPEQWEGRTLTPGVDQWALAVIVYEMCSGHLPFQAPTWPELLRQVQNANPPRPPLFSTGQWQALKKAFSLDRFRRYRNCCEFVETLADAAPGIIDTSPTVCIPPPKTKPPAPPGAPAMKSPPTAVVDSEDLTFVVASMKARDQAKRGRWAEAETALKRASEAGDRDDPRLDPLRETVRRLVSQVWTDEIMACRADPQWRALHKALGFRLAVVKARQGDLNAAFELLKQMETGEDDPVQLLLKAQTVRAAARQGAGSDIQHRLEELVREAHASDQPLAARVFLEIGRAYTHLGDAETAAPLFYQSAALCPQCKAFMSHPAPILTLRSFLGSRAQLSGYSTRTHTTTRSLTAQDAYAELAQAQAEAGLTDDAMATLTLVSDTWIISQASVTIVATLLEAGQVVEATRISESIQHKQARARSLTALAAFHARRSDLEGADRTLRAIEIPHQRAPVLAQMAAMNLLEKNQGLAKDLVRQALAAASQAPSLEALVSLLLQCAKPLLAFHYDEPEGSAVAKPFLEMAEQHLDQQNNPATAFLALLELIDLCSSVWMLPRVTAIGHDELDRHIGDALGRLQVIQQPEEREGAYSALAFAVACNNRSGLEAALFSKARGSEQIFVRLGLIEGMV